jgi:L-ascorbate metabolism protein UlaG (beta-lactamase superfamily)
MMITWHGFSCIKLSENTKDGELAVLIDPFKEGEGAKLPRTLAADILVSTVDLPRHANTDPVAGGEGAKAPFLISTPGEFEVKDIFVTTFEVFEEDEKGKQVMHSIPLITMGEMHILHLGGLRKPLNEKVVAEIGSIDVLLIPVGGGEVMTPAVAAKVVQELEPRVIVPMYFKADGVGDSLEPVDAFLKRRNLLRRKNC